MSTGPYTFNPLLSNFFGQSTTHALFWRIRIECINHKIITFTHKKSAFLTSLKGSFSMLRNYTFKLILCWGSLAGPPSIQLFSLLCKRNILIKGIFRDPLIRGLLFFYTDFIAHSERTLLYWHHLIRTSAEPAQFFYKICMPKSFAFLNFWCLGIRYYSVQHSTSME